MKSHIIVSTRMFMVLTFLCASCCFSKEDLRSAAALDKNNETKLSSFDKISPEAFKNPPLEARPGALWCWLNGNVDHGQMTREMEEAKSLGMRGFGIWDIGVYRPVNMVPAGPAFLGEESLKSIKHAVTEAKRLGLELNMIAASSWNAGGAWVKKEDGSKRIASSSPRIVNVINFIRQCEPRIAWITQDILYETVVEQIKTMMKHQLKGTFLLQYDALIDARYQKLLKGLPAEMFEIGVWWEIPQPLVENSGYQWRGRLPWDWHADVGFATGYSPKEREKLTDTYMADFIRIFGTYPKSVGSWFIDAHTLQYMHDRYGIVASCNCKDQIGTDGYTLWGGYWNQGYYPSRQNAYMPAQNSENQIPVPIFRMLGSDPIHQYDSGLGTAQQRVISLEPVYKLGGGDAEWCRWYFDAFVNGAAMAYGYVQSGQENSFTWDRMSTGFQVQMSMIAGLLKEGKVTVQTLGETGKWFKDRYPVTPPTSVTVLRDHSEKDQKTVWFNSRFYRANLLWEQGTMRVRDIHLFDEAVASDYLTKRGTSSQCFYHTLPFVDGFIWSSLQTVAGLRLKSARGLEIKGGDPAVDDRTDGVLIVRWPLQSPVGEIIIVFNETSISVSTEGSEIENWFLELSFDKKAELPFRKIDHKKVLCSYRNVPYVISAIQGVFTKEPSSGLRIIPEDKRIVLDFSSR